EYRLPSEAEWEYACRGGHFVKDLKEEHTLPFHFDQPSSSLRSSQANFNGNYPDGDAPKGPFLGRTCKVGSYAPNPFGLYDMHGNVWEWCADWYGEYPPGPVTDPHGPSDGSVRVYRGGSWRCYGRFCRAACRFRDTPGTRSNGLGFRVAAVPHE